MRNIHLVHCAGFRDYDQEKLLLDSTLGWTCSHSRLPDPEPAVGSYGTQPRYAFSGCGTGNRLDVAGSADFNALMDVHRHGASIQLPFDFTEVVENLRLERYRQKRNGRLESFAASEPVRKFYYLGRKCLPFRVRRQLQRIYFQDWKELSFPAWPVDFTVDTSRRNLPANLGSQWGEKAAFYLVLARWRAQLRHHDARRGNLRGPRLHLQSDGSG